MKSVVVVPTYNESANAPRLIADILALPMKDLSVLVVDDKSPDGTARLVAEIGARDPRVRVAERMDDRGRGTAGITGFQLAMDDGADVIIEMDADFQHPPGDIPRLLEALGSADISIASRLVGGARDGRPGLRRMVTTAANRYARFWLERPFHKSVIQDWTTGFRAYKRAVFERIPCSTLVSRGPSILQEILFRALNQGFTATEIPFAMQDRVAGVSTFSRKVAIQSLISIPAYRILYGSTGPGVPEFRPQEYRIEKRGNSHLQLFLKK